MLEHTQTVELPGNALSVISINSDNHRSIVVSVDCIHKSGSTTEHRDSQGQSINPLHSYAFQSLRLIPTSTFEVVDDPEKLDNGDAMGRLTNLLYSLENLRKSDGDSREED